MTSRTTKRFRNNLRALPAEVRKQGAEAYQLVLDNPRHSSLN